MSRTIPPGPQTAVLPADIMSLCHRTLPYVLDLAPRTRRRPIFLPRNRLATTAATAAVEIVEKITTLTSDVRIAARYHRAKDAIYRRLIGPMTIFLAVLSSDVVKPVVHARVLPSELRSLHPPSCL